MFVCLKFHKMCSFFIIQSTSEILINKLDYFFFRVFPMMEHCQSKQACGCEVNHVAETKLYKRNL